MHGRGLQCEFDGYGDGWGSRGELSAEEFDVGAECGEDVLVCECGEEGGVRCYDVMLDV